MKKLIAIISLTVSIMALTAAVPEVTNVIAAQQNDHVMIDYTLTHADAKHCLVSVEVSNDGGNTYTITPTALSGDIGIVEGTPQGTSYQILWNYEEDGVGVGDNYRVKVIADDEITPIISPEVVLVDEVMENAIVSVGDNEVVFYSDVDPQTYQIGKIIIKEPSEQIPEGLVRKVTGFSIQGGQIVVTTVQAKLEDIFDQLFLSIDEPLRTTDVESVEAPNGGVSLRKDYKNPYEFILDINQSFQVTEGNDAVIVEITGTVSTNMGYIFETAIDLWHGLHYLRSGGYSIVNSDQTVTVSGGVTWSPDGVDLFTVSFPTVFMPIAGVPFWFKPEIEFEAEWEVYCGSQIEIQESASTSYSGGLVFNKPNWSTYYEHNETYGWEPPNISTGVSAELMVSPQFELEVYSVAELYFAVGPYLEFTANPLSIPWWTLYGGLKASAGVELEVLTYEADYSVELFDYRTVIAQAEEQTGTFSGTVRDAITNVGLAAVIIKVYNSSNEEIATGMTNIQGQYTMTVTAGSGYRVCFIKEGFHTVIYNNVSVSSNQTTTLETVLQIDETYMGTGSASGYIYNALNGNPVAGVTLSFRPGINSTTGTISGSTTSLSNGSYSITSLETGNYTVEASKTGYITTYFSVIIIGGQNTGGQNGVITPDLDDTEVRIVLTWGQTPRDLDSHITGPNLAGGRFHVYYGNRNYYYDNMLYCNLDVDDVTSYGPETVTIYHQSEGMYRYSVHDYTNRHSTDSYILSNSGAIVRVYFGAELQQTFYVPTNRIGTLWTVFELVNGVIYPINAMTNVSNPGTISKGEQTDAELLINLPAK